MTNIQAMAGASVGHVRACFSGRCRGFAAPVDLMRAHLRAVNRCAVRRRVASAFAGYLVTDAGPDVLPVWRDFSGRVVCLNAAVRVHGLRGGFEGFERESLDAPDYLAAGSVLRHECGGEVWAVDRRVFRAGWLE